MSHHRRVKKPQTVEQVPPRVDNNLLQDEAAHYLRSKPRTLEKWRLEGVGPAYVKVGHRVVYRRADLERWMESRLVDPAMR